MPGLKASIVIFLISFTPGSYALLLPKPVFKESFINSSPPKEHPRVATWVKVSTLSATALLLPAMTFLGAFLANPQWSVLGNINSYRGKIAYIDHTTSVYTVPLTALFALVGTAPLWGIFAYERVK